MSEQKYFRRKRTVDEVSENESSLTVSEESSKEVEENSENVQENTEISEEIEEKNVPVEVESHPLTLSASQEEILKRVNETNSIEELKDLANLFGISLTKKEIARASKESNLLDVLLEKAEARIKDKGDYLSNDEILEFMKAFQGNINSSKKSLNDDIDKSSISITKNEVTVNVNTESSLPRESRDKVLEVVNMILKGAQNTEDVQYEEPAILETENNEE